MPGSWDLTALVNAADPKAGLAERHLWLVRLTEWLRHAPTVALLRSDEATPLPALRLRQLLRQLDQHPEPAARVRGLADAFWRDIDTPSLARAEWEHIQRVLADCDGNISESARRLGIHRRSLQRKLQKYPPRQ